MPKQAYNGIVLGHNGYGARVYLVAAEYDPLLKHVSSSTSSTTKGASEDGADDEYTDDLIADVGDDNLAAEQQAKLAQTKVMAPHVKHPTVDLELNRLQQQIDDLHSKGKML